MEICKYCNSIMLGEYETKRNQSYDFFFACPECKSMLIEKKNQIKCSNCDYAK